MLLIIQTWTKAACFETRSQSALEKFRVESPGTSIAFPLLSRGDEHLERDNRFAIHTNARRENVANFLTRIGCSETYANLERSSTVALIALKLTQQFTYACPDHLPRSLH